MHFTEEYSSKSLEYSWLAITLRDSCITCWENWIKLGYIIEKQFSIKAIKQEFMPYLEGF